MNLEPSEVILRLPILVTLATLAAAGCSRELPDLSVPTTIIEAGKAQAGAGLYSSLAVDGDGAAHAAYFHADLHTLRHAVWKDGAWQKTSVDAPGEKMETGRHARIAAAGNKVYIAYQKRTFKDAALEQPAGEQTWLAVSADQGETFAVEPVDESSFRTGEFVALGLTQQGPVVAYYESTNGDLMLARKAKGGWSRSAVEQTGDVGRYVSLDVSVDGNTHLAYYDASAGGLKYAAADGDAFVIETVDGFAFSPTDEADTRNAGTWAQLRAQPEDAAAAGEIAPKIVYYDESDRILRLAEKSDAGWKTSVIDVQAYAGTDSSFLWLPDGSLVVAYFDGYTLDAKLARRNAGAWSHQTVLSQGAVGLYNALVNLGGGKLAMSSYDLTRGALHYVILPVRP